MKGFLKKRWGKLPIGILAVVLALVLATTGVVFAAYNFAQVGVAVTVEEAFILSVGAGDDLNEYMEGGGVIPLVTYAPAGATGLTVTIAEDPDVDASEFCPGEQLVIPVNVRNCSDADLTIEASWAGGGGNIQMDYGYAENTNGDAGFQFSGAWDDLDQFSQVVLGHNGNFGSAQAGADVLFIKITVASDAPIPAQPYILTVTFNRS